MRTTGGEKNGLTGGTYGSPAIWIYGAKRDDVTVQLKFHGAGFMTSSTPNYNDLWRVHIDPEVPYNRYSSTYADDPWVPFLDYDGFRDGTFQTETGWVVENKPDAVVSWHRQFLAEYGFNETEIDDVNSSYVRMLLDRGYKEKYFVIHPQDAAIVDRSVSLTVTPAADSVSRLWLYFVPADKAPARLERPAMTRVKRDGYAVIEVAYLTDREIPKHVTPSAPGAQSRVLRGLRRPNRD